MLVPRSQAKRGRGSPESQFLADPYSDVSQPQFNDTHADPSHISNASPGHSPYARRNPDRMYANGDSPDERSRKDRQREEWLAALEQQVRDKKRRAEEEDRKRRIQEEREEREAREYNPFGRPGAGAPHRSPDSEPIADLSRAKREGRLESQTRVQQSQDSSFQSSVLYPEKSSRRPKISPKTSARNSMQPHPPVVSKDLQHEREALRERDTRLEKERNKAKRKEEIQRQLQEERRAVHVLEDRIKMLRTDPQGTDVIGDASADSSRSSTAVGGSALLLLKEFIREENQALREQLKRHEAVVMQLLSDAAESKAKNQQLLAEVASLKAAWQPRPRVMPSSSAAAAARKDQQSHGMQPVTPAKSPASVRLPAMPKRTDADREEPAPLTKRSRSKPALARSSMPSPFGAPRSTPF